MDNNNRDKYVIFGIPLFLPIIIFFGCAFFAEEIALKIINACIDYAWAVLLLSIVLCVIFSYAHEYENNIQRGVFGTLFSLTSSLKVFLFFGASLPALYAFVDSTLLGRLIGIFVLLFVFGIVGLFSIVFLIVIKLIRWHIDMESLSYIPLKLSLTFVLDLFLTAVSYLFIRGFCIHVYEEAFQTYMADSIYAYIMLLQ